MTTLVDPSGDPVATVRPDDAASHSGFVGSSDGRDPSDVADAVLRDLAGWTLRTTEQELALVLRERGARLVRDSLLLVRPLTDVRFGPTAIPTAPLSADAGRLVPAYTNAYPPGHPDHEAAECDPVQAALTLATYLRGEVVGPLIADASFEANDEHGAAIGAVIVSQMPGDAEYEGSPWVTEIFVHPDHHGRGVGRALLVASLSALASMGHSQLGLAVSVGNPAEHLYRSLGFIQRVRTWKLTIPGPPAR